MREKKKGEGRMVEERGRRRMGRVDRGEERGGKRGEEKE